MKQFTRYSIGRGLNKVIGLFIALAFITAVSVTAVESYQADCSTGIEHVQHQNNSDRGLAVVVAMLAIPAIHSLRLTSTLGFQKQRIWVSELGYYVTHAGLALWNHLTRGKTANEQTRKELMEGNLIIRGFNDFLRFTITGQSGNQEIFTSTSQWRQGRIPEIFNNGELPQGTNIALAYVGGAYATDASVTVPEADVDYTRVVTAWPAALKNSELVIHQNTIKDRFALGMCGSQANGTQSGVETDGLELDKIIILEEKKPIKLELRYANGQAISGTNNHFLELGLQGAICTRKN